MTVASSVNRTVASGNGAATTFAYTFKIISSSHLVVVRSTAAGVDTTLTLGVHYSVSNVGSESGGYITYPLSGTALPVGDRIIMLRSVPLTQLTDLTNQGAFYAEVHESEYDLLCMADQQLSERLDRSVTVPPSDTTALVLPNAVTRAGRYFTFDGSGNASTSPIAEVSGSLMAMETTGSGAQTVWTLPAVVAGGSRSLVVSVDGVVQPISSYTVSGTTLTFGEAPPLNSAVDIRIIGAPVVVSLADSTQVTATGSTTARTLAARFADTVNVLDFGAVGDGTTDDTAAFAAAFTALGSTGGRVLLARGKRHLIDSSLTVPDLCSIIGPHVHAGQTKPSLDFDGLASLLINSSATITLGDGASVIGCTVVRKGLALPFANAAAALTGLAAFAGTAFTIGGQDTSIRDCMIIGFALAVTSTAYERQTIRDVLIDCTGGIYLNNATDIARLEDVHCWPFTTAHQGMGESVLTRSGVAFTLSTDCDWARVTNCFCYGYATGFLISAADDVVLMGCGADYVATGTSTSLGYSVVGDASNITFIGCTAAAQGTGWNINVTATARNSIRLVGCSGWENDTYQVNAINGAVTISAGLFRGGGATAGIAFGASADAGSVSGTVLESIGGTTISINPAAADKISVYGNTYVSCTDVVGTQLTPDGVKRFRVDDSGNCLFGENLTFGSASARLQVNGTAADALISQSRFVASTSGPEHRFAKSRGAAVGTNTAVVSGDVVGATAYYGADGSSYFLTALARATVGAAVSAGVVPGQYEIHVADAAGTLREQLRITASGVMIHRSNATTVVDASSHLGLRSYTVATLPSAGTAARLIYVSDGTSNKRLAVSDGTNWRWPDGAVVS
jgi:hypothetical protein